MADDRCTRAGPGLPQLHGHGAEGRVGQGGGGGGGGGTARIQSRRSGGAPFLSFLCIGTGQSGGQGEPLQAD
jgi:hypothetical protein